MANSAATAALCIQCLPNNTLSNGACYACPGNCTQCALPASSSSVPICLQCALGFGLNDATGGCIQCPANCDYCDGSGVCTQCRQASWTQFASIVDGQQYTTSPPMTANSFTPINAYPGTQSATQVSAFSNSFFAVYVPQGYWLPPNQCQQCPYNCSMCLNTNQCVNNCTKGYNFTLATTTNVNQVNVSVSINLGTCLPLGAERIILAGFAMLSVFFYFI
jgi:hypothetical protein